MAGNPSAIVIRPPLKINTVIFDKLDSSNVYKTLFAYNFHKDTDNLYCDNIVDDLTIVMNLLI
jgi:hypothetical protein